MFLEVLKQVDLLDKKFDAFMIEVLKKLNTITEVMGESIAPPKGIFAYERESAAERDEPVQNTDLPPSLLDKLQRTEDGGLKPKVGMKPDDFKVFNQEMWAHGYKYVSKRGFYPR
jgi:hypothetical protein